MKQQCTTPTFVSYRLPDDVLYSDQELIVNVRERIVTLMEDTAMRAQVCLSVQAWVVMQALLDASPASCP